MDEKKKPAQQTYKVSISKNALQNIDEITGYIAFIKQQPYNAIKAGDALFEMCETIGRNPLAYKECKEIPTKSKMYRSAYCLSWHIVFRIKESNVLILGIIHHSGRPSKIKKLRVIK
ncbi:MAG: type II toxin-antitoxin system RelE/ParE family toxin [Chitinophagaceae bacterium]|nr:type II toxin-antitoxin system RelE/ParE family toxin [Chitinophagaceae bacterium]